MVLSKEEKKIIEDEERYREAFRTKIKKEKNRKKIKKSIRETSKPKPKKKGKGCLTIIGLLIGFIILTGAIGNGGENEKPTPTPKPIKEEVKENPESNLDEADKVVSYASSTVRISDQVAEAMSLRSEIVGRWPNWTSEDTIKFAAAGISLENSYTMAKELTPPEIMVSVHQKMLKGLKLYAESVPIGNEGIDNVDPELIEKSADLINEGTVWINKAVEEVDEIVETL